MKRRLFSLAVILVCVAMVLTACGQSSNSDTTKTDTTAATTTAATAADATQAHLKGNIVYWSQWNENETQATVFKSAIADFEAANKDVKIKVQWNGRDNKKLIQPALDAGTQIDIFDCFNDDLPGYEKYLLKLDDYFTKPYPSTNGKTLADSITPAFLKLIQTSSSDKTSMYGIPYQPYIFSIPYNKALFTKAGITAAPKTWAELMDACAKLKASGVIPLTLDDAYLIVPMTYIFVRYLGLDGVSNLSKDTTGAAWDDPKVLAAAKTVEALASNGYVSQQVATNKYPAGQQEFAMGKAAMYFGNGTWLPNEIKDSVSADFQWGWMGFPTVDGGAMGLEGGICGTQGLVVSNKSQAPDAAVAFIASLVAGKYDSELSKQTMGIAVGSDSNWAPELADAKAVFQDVTINIHNWGGWSDNADKQAIVQTNFISLLTGKISAEKFVSNCKNNVK